MVIVVFKRIKGGYYGSDEPSLLHVLNRTATVKLIEAGTPLTGQTVQRIRQKIAGKSGATGGKNPKSAPTTDSPVPMARLTPAGEDDDCACGETDCGCKTVYPIAKSNVGVIA